jgi:DNA-binding NtrC family response regulator
MTMKEAIEEAEKNYLMGLLQRYNYFLKPVWMDAKITRRTLHRNMRKYGLGKQSGYCTSHNPAWDQRESN